jgi:hypothetical protein
MGVHPPSKWMNNKTNGFAGGAFCKFMKAKGIDDGK